MEIYIQAESIPVLYVKADSFPDGIMPAFDKLKRLISDEDDRQLFGISRPERGVIQYKAGALENFLGEGRIRLRYFQDPSREISHGIGCRLAK